MRYLRIGLLVVMIISAVFLSAEEYQNLTSEGKKNLRSANMHLGGQRIEKALPFYEAVAEENPDHIEALEKIAGIYYDYQRDYYTASDYYTKAIHAVDKEIAAFEKLITETPKKEKKFRKKIAPLQEKKDNMILIKTSCWSKLFQASQYKISLANDYFNLNPQALDLADENNIKTLNVLLTKVLVDTIDIATIATDSVNIDTISEPFSSLLDTTIDEFEKLYEFAPDSVITIKMLSFAYSIKQNEEESVKYMILVAEKDPNDIVVRQKIANHYYSKEEYHEALNWFMSAEQTDPHNVDNYANIGYTYEKLDDLENALGYFDKLLEIDSTNINIAIYARNVATRIGDKPRAIGYLKHAAELDPENIELLIFLTPSLFEIKKYEETIEYAQRWYQLDKTSSLAAQYVYQSAKASGNTELEQKFEKILTDMQ
jgi:tetratricopeptide (TPR) repeat protein